MNTNESHRSDDRLVKVIQEAFTNQPVPPRPSDEELLGHLALSEHARNTKLDVTVGSSHLDDEAPDTLPERKPQKRNTLMKVMIPFTALAASLALVTSFWPQNSVLAQVVRNIEQAKAVTFSINLKIPDIATLSGAGTATSNKLRLDWTTNEPHTTEITDYDRGEQASFTTNSQQVTVMKLDGLGGFDPIRQLKELDRGRTRELFADQNNIENTTLYEFEAGSATGRVWVKKNTLLPVRIEMKSPDNLGEVSFSDFDWNATVDRSTFAVPKNRTVVKDDLYAAPTEAELIAAFTIRNAFTDEPYEADFFADGCGLRLGRLAFDRDLTKEEKHQRQLEKLKAHLGLIGLTQAQAQDAKKMGERIDYLCMKLDQWQLYVGRHGGWVGDGVKPGDVEPICWWQLPGKGVRILRGDLKIEDADAPPQTK